MKKIASKIKVSINDHLKANTLLKKNLSPVASFFIIAAMVTLGYFAGVYHYQVEAAIGPVFGYKAHSGEIDVSSLQKTYSNLAANYDGELDINKLIQGANRGLVEAAGDDYTTYFSPEEAIEFNNALTGNIGGGIGAEIGQIDGKIVIIRPLKDNPAILAGLQANDLILSVNDESTDGWTVEKAVSLIRGEVGTTVKIKIQRETDIKEFTVTRAIINNPSVDSSITDGIGILTISRFDNETGNLANAAAAEFKEKGVKAVILDLRGNGGGYVTAAVDVASLWLDNKVIVTERAGDKVKETLLSKSNALLAGVPTIVLVDGGSASASEIVAGALQDHKVARLVGTKTFGKGSVQLPIKLDNGAEMKVTVARWYTPNGKNITKEGIEPDSTVTFTQNDINTGVDVQLNEAIRLLNL